MSNSGDSSLSRDHDTIPPLPYVRGFETLIEPHTPPDPYGSYHYEICHLNVLCYPDIPQVEAVLRVPPREAAPGRHPPVGDETQTPCSIEILEVIAGGQDRGAQVVRCIVRGHAAGSSAQQQISSP